MSSRSNLLGATVAIVTGVGACTLILSFLPDEERTEARPDRSAEVVAAEQGAPPAEPGSTAPDDQATASAPARAESDEPQAEVSGSAPGGQVMEILVSFDSSSASEVEYREDLQEVLHGAFRQDPAAGVRDTLRLLRGHPSETGIEAAMKVVMKQGIAEPLSEEQLTAIEQAAVELAIREAVDLEARTAILRGLEDYFSDLHTPSAATQTQLLELMQESHGQDVRGAAMAALQEVATGSEDYHHAIRDIILGDLDPDVRAEALRILGGSEDQTRGELFASIMQTEIDPMILRAAADLLNLGNANEVTLQQYREGARALLDRDVDDRARGMAAAGLCVLAIADGDSRFAAQLVRLADSTSDPHLAETAHAAAEQLAAGNLSAEDMNDLWEDWYRR